MVHTAILTEFMLIMALLLQLTGLAFAVMMDTYLRKEQRKAILMIVSLTCLLIVQNIADYMIELHMIMPFARTVIAIIGYSIRPIIIVSFFDIVEYKERKRWMWLLVGLNSLIYMTALFSDICFSIDRNNIFFRGPLGYSCHVISGILLVYLFVITVKKFRHEKKLEECIPLLNLLLITAAVITDSLIARQLIISFLTMAIVTSSLFYYFWLHLHLVREHEQSLMEAQRIQIMMTQIQPHFIYNTISTIKVLCRKDPEMAADIAAKFGVYLRQNLDSLGMTEMIPVQTELEHTQIYTDIEMVRFRNIKVEYDISDSDFSLPPLTIQPMVENAIRQGVRIRKEGIVRVIVKRDMNYHEIVIQDNGQGFDADKVETDGGNHIGIRNVRERIRSMCGGSLTIDSHIGTGTTVTIRIPIENNNSLI